jgi:hypothetical protein
MRERVHCTSTQVTNEQHPEKDIAFIAKRRRGLPYNVIVSGLNRNRPQLPDTPPEILEYLWLIDQLYSCCMHSLTPIWSTWYVHSFMISIACGGHCDEGVPELAS